MAEKTRKSKEAVGLGKAHPSPDTTRGSRGALGLSKAQALEMYRSMLKIRRFEEKLFFLFSTRAMPGSMRYTC